MSQHSKYSDGICDRDSESQVIQTAQSSIYRVRSEHRAHLAGVTNFSRSVTLRMQGRMPKKVQELAGLATEEPLTFATAIAIVLALPYPLVHELKPNRLTPKWLH